jgi:uncharacterized repeat protein (TIGR02543 family)
MKKKQNIVFGILIAFCLTFAVLSITGCEGPMGLQGEQGEQGFAGASIVWKGELEAAPENPQINWAYYNTTDGKAYIWDGSEWQILSLDGGIGQQGPNTYLVIFNGNGGTPLLNVSSVKHGSTVTRPPEPEREGCVFLDWYTEAEGGGKWDFTNPVTTNITLYAQWEF